MIGEALATLIVAEFDLTAGDDLVIGRMQETPDVQTVVHEYEGDNSYHLAGFDSGSIDQPRIQIATRGVQDDYAGPRDHNDAIRTYLNRLPSGTYSGVRILRVAPMGTVYPLGPDKSGRLQFGSRYACMVQPDDD